MVLPARQLTSGPVIGSLCCDSAEEAKTLVPSLTDKISDEDLQELLDEITKLMGYGN
jgi:DNA-directed RNA polymerase II subunit RPB4